MEGSTDYKQREVNRKGSYTWRRMTYGKDIHLEGRYIQTHGKELHTREDTYGGDIHP